MKDLANFYSLRIAALHPMYLISILFCAINFALRCTPSNFIPEFDRVREPLEGDYFVCQATPIEWSYGGTFAFSIINYACTLQSWPIMIPFSWYVTLSLQIGLNYFQYLNRIRFSSQVSLLLHLVLLCLHLLHICFPLVPPAVSCSKR